MMEQAPGQAIFHLAKGYELVLASGSPRRSMLLDALGLPFTVYRPRNPEPERADHKPEHYARLAATAKGRECLDQTGKSNKIILAADTVVTIDEKILGKPGNSACAAKMLSELNGRRHDVFSAFYLAWQDEQNLHEHCGCVRSSVHFAAWPDDVLSAYAKSDEPLDKAGAYAIQGAGAFLVDKIEGSFSNVIGLPVTEIIRFMLSRGLILPG